VAISGPMFEDLHGQDIQRTRNFVRPMTTHNDKLGYDWSKVYSQMVRSISEQFSESSYKAFLQEAQTFYSTEAGFKEHLDTITTMLTKYNTNRDTLLKKSEGTRVFNTSEVYPRRIGGLGKKSPLEIMQKTH